MIFFEDYLIKMKNLFSLKILFEFEIFEKCLKMKVIPATSERQEKKTFLGKK